MASSDYLKLVIDPSTDIDNVEQLEGYDQISCVIRKPLTSTWECVNMHFLISTDKSGKTIVKLVSLDSSNRAVEIEWDEGKLFYWSNQLHICGIFLSEDRALELTILKNIEEINNLELHNKALNRRINQLFVDRAFYNIRKELSTW